MPQPAARPARIPASPLGRLRTVPNGITLARTVMAVALAVVGALALYPELWPLAALYLTSFLVVDTMLSLAFLAWPLLSPNDFHQIDARVWRLAWWPPAKCLNTAAVVVLVIVGLTPTAYVVCLTVLGIKVWSCARVLDLLGSRT